MTVASLCPECGEVFTSERSGRWGHRRTYYRHVNAKHRPRLGTRGVSLIADGMLRSEVEV